MHVTNMIMSHRERSAQEAAFLVTGLALRGSNHTTVFVNTHDKLKRTRILRKECINNFDKDYEETDFASDIHDKYARRPLELEACCLAEFAQYWKIKPQPKNRDNLEDDTSDIEGDIQSEQLTLLNSRTIICKRLKPAVLKTPYISHIKNPDEYYYSLILLYFPFRDESKLLDGYENTFDCYQKKFDQLRPNTAELNADMIFRQQELQRALERLNLLREDNREGTEDLGDVDSEDEGENNDEYGPDGLNEEIETPIVNDLALNERINILNKEQLTAFQDIRNQIVSVNNEPLCYCLHGSGGTGKSFVARIVMDLINLQHNTGRNTSIYPKVIVAAPTGVAAKNIKGVTCHSAFALPIEKFSLGEYMKLRGYNNI